MVVEFGVHDYSEDDYIDLEIGSFSNVISSPQQREFEFHLSSSSKQATSPADELFYQGKLLPLHLPPRLQMVGRLLERTEINARQEQHYSGLTSNTTPTATSTPFNSCNVSPVDSRRVSKDFSPEYFTGIGYGYISEKPRKSWKKKLRLMKYYSLGSKLKASKAYIKSLFGKSSSDICKGDSKVADEGTASKAKESSNSSEKSGKKVPFGPIRRGQSTSSPTPRSKTPIFFETESTLLHRRSFSLAIKTTSGKKSPERKEFSFSSSYGSNGFPRLQFLKRCSSANSEIENPIQGAIAHCKQSISTS